MYERNLQQRAKEIIDDLSVFELTYAIRCAKRDYFFGTNQNESGQETRLKNYLSLGTSTLFRGIKASSRLPALDDIHADNVKQVLTTILSNEGGGRGPLSLKYLIASYLFYQKDPVTHHEASKMIDALLTELNNQLALIKDNTVPEKTMPKIR